MCDNTVDITSCGAPTCTVSDITNEVVMGEPRTNSVTGTSLDGGDSWGWVQVIELGEATSSSTFDLWAGATENNANNEGTFVGTAFVEITECDDTVEGGQTSVVTWNVPGDFQFPLDSGLCMRTGSRHVHVSTVLPEDVSNDEGQINEWDISSTSSYENKCCIIGQTCYVILQTSVSSYYCEENDTQCSFERVPV